MKKKLGEILISSGAVSTADIEAALSDQSAGEPARLGDLLVASGKLSSTDLARALAEQYELPFVELPPLPQAVLDLVPLELQRQFRFVPLESDGTELSIAMADLTNVEVLAILEQQWTRVHVSVAAGDEIDALHNTLTGIFQPPVVDGPPAGSLADDLFGSLDLEEPAPAAPPPPVPSPVPQVAPVPAPRATSSPREEELFGDLNLESSRTGIEVQSAEEEVLVPEPLEPGAHVDEPALPLAEVSGPVIEGDIAEASGPMPALSEPSGPILVAADEVHSGPVIEGLHEGTGPLLDMLADSGGTGPVVDTPFFRDSSAVDVVPPLADVPFSSPSSLAAVAIAPPPSTAPAADVVPPLATPAEALPDWLRGGSDSPVPSVGAAPVADEPGQWTGALDHLAPSKLVVGVTKALLARGLVTEAEILAALGQKK
ncbi:MAG: hypothetical protein ACOZQL_36925 [Myxococcota bacterium]